MGKRKALMNHNASHFVSTLTIFSTQSYTVLNEPRILGTIWLLIL